MCQLGSGQPVLIYGAGPFACAVAGALQQVGVPVAGFVVATPAVATLMDCPVWSWSSLDEVANLQRLPLLCGIFNRNDPYQQLDAIARDHGFEAMLMPWDYYPALASTLGWRYWLSAQPEIMATVEQGPAELQQVHGLLHDAESKDLLRRILAFRAGADLAYSAVRSAEPQYFNDLTLPHGAQDRELIYLDVGAYDGDTLWAIAERAALSRALLFEPCQDNLQSLADGVAAFLAEHPGVEVEIMPLALADRTSFGVLCGQGEGATLTLVADGTPQQGPLVHAVRADDLYPALRVDVVKIDAEGSDLACIEGMAGILSRSRPVVAVAVYHRDQDLIEIPRALERILGRQGYRYHLRQHQFNSFDCVLYAVPQP